MDISPALRDDLLARLLCPSPDRARLIAGMTARNPGIADLLMDLEADDDLRAKLEIKPTQRSKRRRSVLSRKVFAVNVVVPTYRCSPAPREKGRSK